MKRMELTQLPYSMDALEPHIGRLTMEFHHGKHHRAYIDNLNKLIASTKFETMSPEEIVKTSDGSIYNNAAQAWNHDFYWNCLSPEGAKEPSGCLVHAMDKKFGGFEEFKKQFTLAALGLFGSGWVWLVKDESGKLEIIPTPNAGNPIRENKIPLLVCDVWEHAYYLDKQNRRADYMESFWKVVDWKKVSQRY